MTQPENPLTMASLYPRRFTTGIVAKVARRLPSPLLRQAKSLVLLTLDCADMLLGHRREMVPPRRLRFEGDGDFEATGDQFLHYFTELCELKPEHRVLEMGCGNGRMARALTRYLTSGSYEGIDIVPKGIRWCARNITSRHPNFRFQLADIQNHMYNPRGRYQPAQYEFPFKDDQFDFIYLTSVFTHMLTPEMEHYMAQIARTLRPQGRCFITFFLLNEEARHLISTGLSSMDFRFVRDGCWLHDERFPEQAVAFEEADIRNLYSKLGLTIGSIKCGSWSGRADYLSYQDVVIARKS